MLNQDRRAYLARHRQAVSITVALLGGAFLFLIVGGSGSGFGNLLAAGAWALGLWIGTHLVVYWLTAGTAGSSDIPRR